MKLPRRLGKLALTSLIIAGMMLSSCAEREGSGGGIEHTLHKIWDWLTGKPSEAVQEKINKTKQLAQDLSNPYKALANVNIKALPKDERKCFEVASEYSGVPLIIMYTFAWKESDFSPKSVNKNHSQTKWDCGITQDNTQEIICPLAYRYTLGIEKFHGPFVREHPQLFKAIQELGLKYVGGGYSGNKYGNCSYYVAGKEIPTLTHEQAREYCSEVGTAYRTSVTPSNPICLGIMIGAYEMAKDYWLIKTDPGDMKKINELMEETGLKQSALDNAGKYAIWVYVAYKYNGLTHCPYGVKCYFYDFSARLKAALAEGEHFFDKFFK
jgi:hypothetical protein